MNEQAAKTGNVVGKLKGSFSERERAENKGRAQGEQACGVKQI